MQNTIIPQKKSSLSRGPSISAFAGRKLRPTGRGGNALFRTFPASLSRLPVKLQHCRLIYPDLRLDYKVATDRLLYLATIELTGRTDLLGDACAQLIDTPESFTWPIEDPLLCVLIAFMREHAFRWAQKVCVKYWTP
jgi:hypothetical protein